MFESIIHTEPSQLKQCSNNNLTIDSPRVVFSLAPGGNRWIAGNIKNNTATGAMNV